MIPAIDSQGECTRISLKRAEDYEQRGRGHFARDERTQEITFVFAREGYCGASVEASMAGAPAPLAGRQSSRLPVVDHFDGLDSGFGLGRYPMPCYVSSGDRFPALARMGAGL